MKRLVLIFAIFSSSSATLAVGEPLLLEKINRSLAPSKPIEFSFLEDDKNYLAYLESVLRPLIASEKVLDRERLQQIQDKIKSRTLIVRKDLKMPVGFDNFESLWLKSPVKCSPFITKKPLPFPDPGILAVLQVGLLRASLEKSTTRSTEYLKHLLQVYENLAQCDLASISQNVVLQQLVSMTDLLAYMNQHKMLSAKQKSLIYDFRRKVNGIDVYHLTRQSFLREEFWIIKNFYDLTETQRIKPERKIWMNAIFEIPNLGEPVASDKVRTIESSQIEASVVKGFWKEFLTLVAVNENLEIGSEEELLFWLTENIRNLPGKEFFSSKEIRESILKTRSKITESLVKYFHLKGPFQPRYYGWGNECPNPELFKLNKEMVDSPRLLKERKGYLSQGPSIYGLAMGALISDFRETRPQDFDADYNYALYKARKNLELLK